MGRARMWLLVLLAAALPLQGCRSMARGARAEMVLVEVQNNVPLPTSFTVYAFSETGSRKLLGLLAPGRPSTLRLTAADVAGNYRFTAVRQLGSAITSPPITLHGGETVNWDLRANTLVQVR